MNCRITSMAGNRQHCHPKDPQGFHKGVHVDHVDTSSIWYTIPQDSCPKAILERIGLVRPKFCNMFDCPCNSGLLLFIFFGAHKNVQSLQGAMLCAISLRQEYYGMCLVLVIHMYNILHFTFLHICCIIHAYMVNNQASTLVYLIIVGVRYFYQSFGNFPATAI